MNTNTVTDISVDQLADPQVFSAELCFVKDTYLLAVLAKAGLVTPLEHRMLYARLVQVWQPIYQNQKLGELTG